MRTIGQRDRAVARHLDGDGAVVARGIDRDGIADCRIVNIPDGRVAVYRGPVRDGAAPFGWRYGRAVTLGAAERGSPPAAAVAVADLLP